MVLVCVGYMRTAEVVCLWMIIIDFVDDLIKYFISSAYAHFDELLRISERLCCKGLSG